LLRGLGIRTLLLTAGFTDVCIHCTFVDAHQNDHFCRAAEDCMAGSSIEAQNAALRGMEYRQTGARRGSVEIL